MGDYGGWDDLSPVEPWFPWEYGRIVAAYNLDKNKILWMHKESKPIESKAMGISSGKLFFYAPASRIGALDIKSGRVLWTNKDSGVLSLIEELGEGLWFLPGFRTTCMMLCTPEAIFFEAQRRENIVALSAENGQFLWNIKKTGKKNPALLFADGKLVIGGIQGENIYMVDPMTGQILNDLGFHKAQCARLTGSPDAFYCRGDGLGVYLRSKGKYVVDGAQRPGCNDGAIPANGLLYVGPWLCDCNLSLVGTIALCSAGDFKFDYAATEEERLEAGEGDTLTVKPLDIDENDWYTYRANYKRSAGTKVNVPVTNIEKLWEWTFSKDTECLSTPLSSAGNLLFLCSQNGKVYCIDGKTGKSVWAFITAGPILMPASIWNGRVFVGSGDGYIYSIEAATGRMLWRFRASPVERRTMIYGSLSSTWPVNSGILISDGILYAAAGIIDRDGTYVYAINALTGKIKWQNNSSGHNNKSIHKGVSAMGSIAIAADSRHPESGGNIWLAGGNQISPAGYSVESGELIKRGKALGIPNANRGCEIGVWKDKFLIYGGRLLYDYEGITTSSSQFVCSPIEESGRLSSTQISIADRSSTNWHFSLPHLSIADRSSIPPAWDDEVFVIPITMYKNLKCWDSNNDIGSLGKEKEKWAFRKYIMAVVVTGNAVVTLSQDSKKTRHTVTILDKKTGEKIWEELLVAEPIINGLSVDRNGNVIVVLKNGTAVCYGRK